MEVVYFGEELQKRAPEYMGMLLLAPGTQWVSMLDISTAIVSGETVTVRPATESEMQRAEQVVILYEIGKQLGVTLGSILDQEEPSSVVGRVTEIREGVESALGDLPAFPVLDKEREA